MAKLTLSPDTILEALMNDPSCPAEIAANSLPFLKHLPSIMGERIHHKVNAAEFVEIQDEFLRFMLERDGDESPASLSHDGVELCEDLIETIDGLPDDIESTLGELGVEPEDLMIPGMNDELREYHRRGQLTFGIMLALQPSLFIPADTHKAQI